MHSISTNSVGCVPIESPPLSWSSGLSDCSSIFSTRWKRTPEKLLPLDDKEFGQIYNLDISEPFYMKFNYIQPNDHTTVVCQLDDYMEVPIGDAEQCLECIREDRLLLETVHIEINACDPKTKIAVEKVLNKFLIQKNKCSTDLVVKRVYFFIYDFSYARDFAKILSIIAPKAFEVNIGIPKNRVYPLNPSTEAGYVIEFLTRYLQPNKTYETIRVLRIYNFISFDKNFQAIFNRCTRLKHLTVSNIEEIGIFEAETIESVLLDSCDFSNTFFDYEFAVKAPRLFPKALHFGYLHCKLDVCTKAIEQFSSRRIGETRNNIRFYQPEKDFRKFLLDVTRNFEIINDDRELEGEIQIRGHKDGPVITVFNKDRIYMSKNE
ncbi:unnamed protein product [Caenorhabditis angaria]|uniref:Uncharacterized protein n=1 Tax=Caenorhabditis angaria TaxID=860376 RepID=A0A9P1I2V9_9PELO|nr:unnamed protein product [Caenorhabditis angaria]